MAFNPNEKDGRPESDKLSGLDHEQGEDHAVVTADKYSNEAKNARRRIRRAMLTERNNQALVIEGHVMSRAILRGWYDEKGRRIGMVDHEGKSIQIPIRQALSKIGRLIHADDAIKLHGNIPKRLQEACDWIDSSVFTAVEGVVNPVEGALLRLREKIANIEKNPDYLFQFKEGGNLRMDLTEILALMKQAASEDLTNNEWVLDNKAALYFPSDNAPAECQARFELNEETRGEILKLAGKNRRPLKIAKRMPGLMAGHLDLLTYGIVTQMSGLFYDQSEELGETDAESMQVALDMVNRCLFALKDIHRTKQVIPALT